MKLVMYKTINKFILKILKNFNPSVLMNGQDTNLNHFPKFAGKKRIILRKQKELITKNKGYSTFLTPGTCFAIHAVKKQVARAMGESMRNFRIAEISHPAKTALTPTISGA